MVFRRALLLIALASCGDSAHDLTYGGDPILVIRAHVDVARLARNQPSSRLWGALYWAIRPRAAAEQECKLLDKSPFQAICPDPAGAALDLFPTRTAAIDAEGNFELPLFVRPPLERLDTNEAATSGAVTGTVIVIEDINDRGAPSGPPGLDYRILAASFHSTEAVQERLVYREGDGSHSPFNVFPAAGCPDPGDRFSVVTAGPLGFPCMITALGETSPRLEIPAITPREAQGLACRLPALENIGRITLRAVDPGNSMPTADDEVTCLSPEIVIASRKEMYCPYPSFYMLRCAGNIPGCLGRRWDHTANPPAWWRQVCMR